MLKTKKDCTYCDIGQGNTKDHVIPRSLFKPPRPKMVTVPCCVKCNEEFKSDEDVFTSWIMFGPAGASTEGQSLWKAKRHRTFDKDIGLRQEIARSLKYVNFETEGGIYIKSGFIIEPDSKRIKNVIRKIIRGLFWEEYRERVPKDIEISRPLVSDINDPDVVRAFDIYTTSTNGRASTAFSEETCKYFVVRADRETFESLWIMVFYNITAIVSYVG